ncbi:MAG: hypothetical protein IPF51_09125 [Dehalococcoidia bacterium]|uniref:hypothetical protein n=1 Tax=Candidatus Amarobacter glycogenicus TaxID=3140699 RepID=UPI00313472A8|nr:hypothetical protein [Dehalococcoidia bacterium]
MVEPVYFLTFRTYGTWLHGDPRGSVDREHRDFGEPRIERDDGLLRRRRAVMKNAPFVLDTAAKRQAVDTSIRRTCGLRQWDLLALNVRSNHVHVVVGAESPEEKVLADLKAWATRALRDAGLAAQSADVWSHHGSTRVLTTDSAVAGAILYTLFEQGPPLV